MSFKLNLSNGILTRNVNTQKHYWIKFRAYAFDESELIKLKGKWNKLRIITNSGRTYAITEQDFYTHSIINNEFGKVQRLIGVRYLELEKHVQTLVNLNSNFHSILKKKSKTINKPMNQILIDLFHKEYGNGRE